MPLSNKDFTYYKDAIKEDYKEHSRMIDNNIPDAILDAYEGRICERSIDSYRVTGNMVEDYIFISANTIIPTLFYQMPRPIIKAKREDLRYSSAVIDGLVRAYFGDREKHEIQSCITDAFLAYPFAVMKVAYNSRTGKVPANKVSYLTGETKSKEDGTSSEASYEYLKYEKPFIERISPKYAILDSSKEFGKGKRITFEYQRTLQEIIDSGIYQLDSNFISYFKNKDGDNRKVKLTLKEHFCIKEDGVYKLVYTDDWHEELSFIKTQYTELPCELMRFNKLADRLYTTSHGYLAYEAQKELQYYNELWKNHIDKVRRQHLVDESALTENGKKTLKENEIDGIVYTNKPVTSGVYAQISSNPMGKDVYAGIDNVRNYLKLILSTTGGKGGETEAEFAYTEKQQAVGDTMRLSGLQDTIRDFGRGIIRKTVSNIVKFGNPELTIQITGKNVVDPVTGDTITGKELQLGGQNGLSLKEEIKGSVDTDYIYDIDMTSAQRPDFPIVRKQMNEFIQLLMALEPKLAQEGKKIEWSELVKDFSNTFETINDPSKYIIELSEEDKYKMEMEKNMSMVNPTQRVNQPNQPEITV